MVSNEAMCARIYYFIHVGLGIGLWGGRKNVIQSMPIRNTNEARFLKQSLNFAHKEQIEYQSNM